jgi:UDP-2,4-diacetamido-2,4,6-trideoxy-beta-L-altropyranose hydrolase
MQVVFRTDASTAIGSGHVMRCLTLADALARRGARCRFVCRAHRGNLHSVITDRGFEVCSLITDETCSTWLGADPEDDARQTAVALGDAVDWLVVDHYSIDTTWEERLRPLCHSLMVIDDMADRHHDCDLLLDQNWLGVTGGSRYDALVPASCKKLLGPHYALLKPEFAELRATMPDRSGTVRRILVFMGGSDSGNQTAKALRALMHPALVGLDVDVVIGPNHSDVDGVRELVAQRPHTALHPCLPSLAPLMLEADLMIGAGGSTAWERMCLGLPTIVVSIAANQTPISAALMKDGYIVYAGEKDEVRSADIANRVLNCISGADALRRASLRMQALVDGAGTARVADVLCGWETIHVA